MRAGDLRRRIRIQGRQQTQDALGQPSSVWVDVATVWAAINPASGRELLLAQAVHTKVGGTVTIRYQRQFADPVAMAERRILHDGRYLNITASRDIDEMHQYIELSYSEGVNEG